MTGNAAGSTAPAGPAAAVAAARPGGGPAGARAAYETAAAAARERLAAAPPSSRVRLAKPTSNLFRPRVGHTGIWLDAAPFSRVLAVDPAARTAEVGGMTTYDDLVAATLPHGLAPTVVPELRTITVGGAVTGLGIESSSWRYGLPHESVLEMDVLTGDGSVVRAADAGPHADLFRCFPNSYGTLGYALRLVVELVPVRRYVHLRHVRFERLEDAVEALRVIWADGAWQDRPVDFCDGVWFGHDECYLTLGTGTDAAGPTSDYTGREVYYRSIRTRGEDDLTAAGYLWRWDTDWFWCSRAFGAQHPLVRPLWPRRWRRSDVYWRLVALDRRHGVSRRLDRLRGRPGGEMVVQDVEVGLDDVAGFVPRLHTLTGMSPIWLCPLRLRGDRSWPLYPLQPHRPYVNVGFWGRVPLSPGEPEGTVNRRVEQLLDRYGGHKSLYSTANYSAEEFWARYPGDDYGPVKRRYDPAGRFPDLYEKAVRGG